MEVVSKTRIDRSGLTIWEGIMDVLKNGG